jgi:hypothetical protein
VCSVPSPSSPSSYLISRRFARYRAVIDCSFTNTGRPFSYVVVVMSLNSSTLFSPTCYKFYIGITANTVGYTADERTQIFYEVRRIRTSTETIFNYNSNSDENVIPPLCFIFKAEIH